MTPLPWVARQEFANRWRIEQQVESGVPFSIALVTTTVLEMGANKNAETAANAAFIVKACNEYASLKQRADVADKLADALIELLAEFRAATKEIGVSDQIFEGFTAVKNSRAALSQVQT